MSAVPPETVGLPERPVCGLLVEATRDPKQKFRLGAWFSVSASAGAISAIVPWYADSGGLRRLWDAPVLPWA
jgi:hypothetical protein